MYIHEAVELAQKAGKLIRRTGGGPIWASLRVDPTNTYDGCKLSLEKQNPRPRWQPQAEDLCANDWEVV